MDTGCCSDKKACQGSHGAVKINHLFFYNTRFTSHMLKFCLMTQHFIVLIGFSFKIYLPFLLLLV